MPITVVTSGAVQAVNGATLNAPFTLAAGTDFLIVLLTSRGNTTADTSITSVTYGGVVLTHVVDDDTAGFSVHSHVYVLNQAGLASLSSGPGSYTLSIQTPLSQQIAAAQLQLQGVDQSNPVNATASYLLNVVVPPPPQPLEASVANTLIIDCIAADFSGSGLPNAGQTEIADHEIGGLTQLSSYEHAAAAGTHTLGWDTTNPPQGPNRQATVLVAFQQSGSPPPPSDGIQHQASAEFVGSATTFSQAFSISAQSDRMLLVGVAVEGGTINLGSVTYAGVSMSLVDRRFVGGAATMEVSIFQLGDSSLPTSAGSNALQATFAPTGASLLYHVYATELFGVADTTAESTATNANTSNPSNITTNISSLTDGAWAYDVLGSGDDQPLNPNAGQVERGNLVSPETPSISSGASTKPLPSAGTDSMGWIFPSGTNRAVHVVAIFAPAGVEPPPDDSNVIMFGTNF